MVTRHQSTEALGGSDVLSLVNIPTEATLLTAISDCLDQGKGFAIATLNVDHIVKLRRDTAFHRAYLAQTHVVADGNPIVWLTHLEGRRDIRLVPGSEIIKPLATLAARKSAPVAFFGSRETVLQAAARQLLVDHPGLVVSACIAPPMGFDPDSSAADALLDDLAASGAKVVFIALGAPKQENFAARGIARHPQMGFVSIGAGLDFIAGFQTRAPLWVRRIAMEWLWRMLSDPRRLAKRYIDCALILPDLAIAARRQVRDRKP